MRRNNQGRAAQNAKRAASRVGFRFDLDRADGVKRERIQKILSLWGIAARRKAENLIIEGRVSVNGKVAKIGDSADPERDAIAVDGKRIFPSKGGNIYLALYKPRGYLTAMSDERGRRCVSELVSDLNARVYPVGRLDKDSEGLLLMTNDGDFAQLAGHPSGRVKKTYRVTVRPNITDEELARIESGILIDGVKTSPIKVTVLKEEHGRAVIEMVLTEGRNREIRKICEALGLEVARLKRVAIGPVRLGMLHPGEYRELTREELREFRGGSINRS